MEASESKNPELLPYIRASYGLAGIVYEVTFKLKPLEIISFNYDVHDVEDLKDSTIKKAISVEPEHRPVDDRRRHRDSVAQQGEEAEARVAGRREGVRLELPGRLHRPRPPRSLRRRRASARSRSDWVGARAGVLSSAQRRRRVHARGARTRRSTTRRRRSRRAMPSPSGRSRARTT